jgi:hypothetical protein
MNKFPVDIIGFRSLLAEEFVALHY